MSQQPKGIFARIIDSLTAGVVVEQLEAEMYPTSTPGGKKIAELEFKRYKPGNTKLEFEIEDQSWRPVGDEVVVQIHGVEVCRHTIKPVKNSYKIYSDRGDEVPPVKLGDEASLVLNGQVIATGIFRLD